jgi:hypothetical protein
MNVKQTQLRAHTFARITNKINEAQPGQIAISYADENGNKATGYIDLFDIIVSHDGKDETFGAFLVQVKKDIASNQETIGRLLVENLALQQQVAQCEARNAEMLSEQKLLKQKYAEVWAWLFPDRPFGL